MAKEAGEAALEDARIHFSDVEQAVVGYVYGESTCGQRAVYPLGMTGIPIYNVGRAHLLSYSLGVSMRDIFEAQLFRLGPLPTTILFR